MRGLMVTSVTQSGA